LKVYLGSFQLEKKNEKTNEPYLLRKIKSDTVKPIKPVKQRRETGNGLNNEKSSEGY